MAGTTSPPAVVTVGAVGGIGGASSGPVRPSQFPPGDFMILNHYERDGQTYMAGLTSPTPFEGATVGVFRLGGPTVLWVAEWTACNVGLHPDVPDPTPPPGWVLLDINLSQALVGVGPSEVDEVHRISGSYVYAKLNPTTDPIRHLTQEVSYPNAPWLTDGVLRKVPLASLKKILDPAQPGGSGAGEVGTDTGQGLTPPQFFVEAK